MKHLTPEELIDFADGSLAEDRRVHLEACQTCRREARACRSIVAGIRADQVPEPSPLFWDHFSTRIREAVARAEVAPRWWDVLTLPRLSGAAIAGALLVALVSVARGPDAGAPRSPAAVLGEAAPAGSSSLTLSSEPAWTVVMAVSEGMDWDAATEAGLQVRPGAAERALMELSPEEQIELGRLLRAELGEPIL
jgi:hypothetical protein